MYICDAHFLCTSNPKPLYLQPFVHVSVCICMGAGGGRDEDARGEQKMISHRNDSRKYCYYQYKSNEGKYRHESHKVMGCWHLKDP